MEGKTREQLLEEIKKLRLRIDRLEAVNVHLKKLQEEEQSKWERYRLISENTSDLIAVATFSLNPVYTYISPSHKKIMGYEPEDLLGKPGLDYVHHEDKTRLLPLLKQYVTLKLSRLLGGKDRDASERFEYRVRDKTGNWHYLESTVNIIKDELLFISRDITKQKEAVESIKLAYAELMQIFNNTVEGVRVIDKDHNVLLINKTFSTIAGLNEEEMTGKKCYEVFSCSLCRTPRCLLTRILAGESPVTCDTDIERKDNKTMPCTVTATPFQGSAHEPIGIVENFRDITERKKMEQHLIHSEKLKSLEELAGGVAHTFNNILAAILGRAQLLTMNLQTPHGITEKRKGMVDLKKSLEVIEQAALDGARTVRRIQDFSRKRGESVFTPVNINDVIDRSLEITRARWRDESQAKDITIAVKKELAPLPHIEGNAAELEELFTNLIHNAVDAMPQGGALTIKTLTEKGQIVIMVNDTGTGIPAAIRERIFDPFFTTKGVRSTGLGLSAAYGIINRHGGSITATDLKGKGSSFIIKFPASESPVEERTVALPAEKIRNARILVIEDEEDLRNLLADILKMQGVEVEAAASGREGLALFASKHFDLVFTDLGMPEMSGWQVAKEVKRLDSKTPVALITGWHIQLNDAEKKEKGVDLLVNKPFKVEEIHKLVENGIRIKDRCNRS